MGVQAPSTSSQWTASSSATLNASSKRRSEVIDLTGSDHETSPKPKKAKTIKDSNEEKRLRRFRPSFPKTLQDVYQRALTQKFFVLTRTRCGTEECPEEFVELAGSTGNIYNVVIARVPSCDCPHARGGNQCKHTLFVMAKVLCAKYEYVYQRALLSTELQDIFDHAPLPRDGGGKCGHDKRKPVEGDCPICFNAMLPAGEGDQALVWCKTACGQNIHKVCFDMWATTKRRSGGEVTCPYCRSEWEDEGQVPSDIKRTGPLNSDGYVNVASQLGISGVRDYSTYSRFSSFNRNSWGNRW